MSWSGIIIDEVFVALIKLLTPDHEGYGGSVNIHSHILLPFLHECDMLYVVQYMMEVLLKA
jgi:hypothetical protein